MRSLMPTGWRETGWLTDRLFVADDGSCRLPVQGTGRMSGESYNTMTPATAVQIPYREVDSRHHRLKLCLGRGAVERG